MGAGCVMAIAWSGGMSEAAPRTAGSGANVARAAGNVNSALGASVAPGRQLCRFFRIGGRFVLHLGVDEPTCLEPKPCEPPSLPLPW